MRIGADSTFHCGRARIKNIRVSTGDVKREPGITVKLIVTSIAVFDAIYRARLLSFTEFIEVYQPRVRKIQSMRNFFSTFPQNI